MAPRNRVNHNSDLEFWPGSDFLVETRVVFGSSALGHSQKTAFAHMFVVRNAPAQLSLRQLVDRFSADEGHPRRMDGAR
jgi:hypothetical protein